MHHLISLVFILVLLAFLWYLYYYTSFFYILRALKMGLDHHLTLVLWQIVHNKNMRCPSKVFKKEDLLHSLLKERLALIESDDFLSQDQRINQLLELYKIRQVIDLGDHSELHLQKTQDFPLFHEIVILWKNLKIKAKIIVNEKKYFALFVDVSANNNERAYAYLFSVEEGNFFDLSFSAGLKEEYRFSAQVLEVIAVDREHFYLALAHTPDVYAVFRHRYRQREVCIEDVLLESVEKIDTIGSFACFFADQTTQKGSIISITMAGCILKLDHPCPEGLHMAITFNTVDGHQLLYYGRTGLSQLKENQEEEEEEDNEQGEYLVEVQFTQSTKEALCYLGEVVYEFRGSKNDAVIGYS